ncbi:hypothetical protein FRC11_002148, partial [Ceratobasidium sp. 423]
KIHYGTHMATYEPFLKLTSANQNTNKLTFFYDSTTIADLGRALGEQQSNFENYTSGPASMSNRKSASPAIQKWEKAGATLGTALNKYLNLSLTLGTSAPKDGTPPNDLAIRIDSALETLHVTLDQRIAKARSTLAYTRNQIMSSTSRLPNEVLSEIFTHVIYPPPDPFEPVPMKQSLVALYHSLYGLLSVCSVWRKILLSRGSLWSMIPIKLADSYLQRNSKDPEFTRLALERAGGADLHLAAILSRVYRGFNGLTGLTKCASQFRTINIVSDTHFGIISILNHFRDLDSSGKLSHLSIRHESDLRTDRLPREFNYIFSLGSNDQKVFESLLKRISVLRLSGVVLHWDEAVFSNRLVELELQEITMGYDSEISKFLEALSSATQLRHFKFSSIKTFPDSPASQTTPINSNISLPNLETLLARNLYYNTLHYLLSSLTSRPRCLTLHLTRKTFEVTHPESPEPEEAPAQVVLDLFREVPISTLILEGEELNPWLSAEDFWEILFAMPNLETLLVDNLDFDKDFCEAMQRRQVDDDFAFPQLKSMFFSQVKIRDEDAFKKMVASYSKSLERMELGALVGYASDFTSAHAPLEEDEDLAVWLAERVPDFELINGEYHPPDFRPPEWHLW